MAHSTASRPTIDSWFNFIMFTSSRTPFPVPEDYVREALQDLEHCTAAIRFRDFFVPVSTLKRVGIWNHDRLERLLALITIQAETYREATANQNSWFSIKLDILFQMYLCVVREAAGVKNDNLPETFSELHSTHGHPCRSRIDALMDKYKSYYLKDGGTGILDGSYQQQRIALMGVFHTNTEKNVFNALKAFELLHAHRVDAFTQNLITFLHEVEEKVLPIPELTFDGHITNGAVERDHLTQQLQPQPTISTTSQHKRKFESQADGAKCVDETQTAAPVTALHLDRKKAGGGGGSVAAAAPKCSSAEAEIAADAAYREEMRRIDKLERGQLLFLRKFIAAHALIEWPPREQDANFDRYWQGKAELDGIHYTKSWEYDDEGHKIGYLTATDGLVLIFSDGVIKGKDWPRC